MAPGDEAPAGTPSTGENVCPVCGGSGRMGASRCENCQGTGKVIVGIGGA
jgi:DnaJ-class molecular chaperone